MEAVSLYRGRVGGVSYITDRYLLIRRDLLPKRFPCEEGVVDMVTLPGKKIRHLLDVDLSGDDPDPAPLAAMYVRTFRSPEWSLVPRAKSGAGTRWHIYRADLLVGAVASLLPDNQDDRTGAYPGDDLTRHAVIAHALKGMTGGGLSGAWLAAERAVCALDRLADELRLPAISLGGAR